MIKRRKWGWYWTILNRKHFKVKLLCFKPYGRLSPQYHYKRNELWLFLGGKGAFYVNGMMASKDESLNGEWRLVSRKDLHTYEAFTRTWVLEIQYGEECREEDIVRVA